MANSYLAPTDLSDFRSHRLVRLLPEHGPSRYLLLISDRLKVDEDAVEALKGPVLKFKEIPNAAETLAALQKMLPTPQVFPFS